MDDLDAGALVEAALRNDDEAARELVRRLYPLVAKVVCAHRPRRTAEEDLCQMIFIRVFQKLSQFSRKHPCRRSRIHTTDNDRGGKPTVTKLVAKKSVTDSAQPRS